MPLLVIIDYGMGNLRSIQFKLHKIGIQSVITASPDDVARAGQLILPGVGHFASGMNNLHKRGLLPVLVHQVLENKTPILGICLGMQLFTKTSQEGGNVSGLGWLDAETLRFDLAQEQLRVPHVGWNTIVSTRADPLLSGVVPEQRFYFTHSYYVHCASQSDVLATTRYGVDFVSVIRKDNIFGVQFHPEKSHRQGVEIIGNFVRATVC